MSAALTERRKADREQMAAMVEELCTQHGVECHRSEFRSPREICLDMECEGFGVSVDFDGDNCAQLLDNYCLPWHGLAGENRLSSAFGAAQCAEVNPFHRRKCTAFARGIDDLLRKLALGFEMLKDGRAFEKRAS